MKLSWLLVCLSSACALGPIRRNDVEGLGRWPDTRSVAISVSPEMPPAIAGALEASAQSFAPRAHLSSAPKGTSDAFELRWRAEPRAITDPVMGLTARPGDSVWVVEGSLFAPGEAEPKGYVRWERAGREDLVARGAGEASDALAERFLARRDVFFERRAADERLFLTPLATTLDAGEVVISNDELLLFRLGVGLGRRVQLDLWVGGLPLPVAGGAVLPAVKVVAGVGGAALGVVGAFDLGLKVKILEESRNVPGLTISYDLLDAFGAVFGAGGGVLIGSGLLVAAGAGVAAANVQFNVFALTVGKHFNHTQLTAGTYVIDNHHLLPQSAAFAAGVTINEDAAGTSGGAPIPRIPTFAAPFVSVEQVLGPHSALAAELLPQLPVEATMLSTGVRWLLGWSEPSGVLALNRIRLRLDVAALWTYAPPRKKGKSGALLPLPLLGLGLYFL